MSHDSGIVIGHYVLNEPTVFTNRSYECAAWSQTIEVAAGKYEVKMLYQHEYRADRSRYSTYPKWIIVKLPGIILEDFFPSLWCGVLIGKPYDRFKNKGKPSTYHIQAYPYIVANAIRDDPKTPWRLKPGVSAMAVHMPVYPSKYEKRLTCRIGEIVSPSNTGGPLLVVQ